MRKWFQHKHFQLGIKVNKKNIKCKDAIVGLSQILLAGRRLVKLLSSKHVPLSLKKEWFRRQNQTSDGRVESHEGLFLIKNSGWSLPTSISKRLWTSDSFLLLILTFPLFNQMSTIAIPCLSYHFMLGMLKQSL